MSSQLEVMYSLKEASQNGDLELCKNIFATHNDVLVASSLNSITLAFKDACGANHFDVARWLWEVAHEYIDLHWANDAIFVIVCENGHLDCAKWLWEISSHSMDCYTNAVELACEYGHLDIVEWLYSIAEDKDRFAQNNAAFRAACNNQCANVAAWYATVFPNMYGEMLSSSKTKLCL